MTAKATFELTAELRDDQGKGASRRLRRVHNKIPAILYGGGEKPLAISLDHKKMMHALENQAFYTHLLTLNIAGKKQQAILKDLQRHHFKKAIFHADFLRVKATDLINMHVPLHFTGEANCPGVKAGGIISHLLMDIEVRCMASNIPEFIEVDLSTTGLDQILHLSDLKLPNGVEVVALSHGQAAQHDYAVVSIHLPRRPDEDAANSAESKVTEVLPKGKEANPATAGTGTAAKTPAPAANKEKGKGK